MVYVDTRDLKSIVTKAKCFKNPYLPITGSVKISARDNILTLEASGIDLHYKASIYCQSHGVLDPIMVDKAKLLKVLNGKETEISVEQSGFIKLNNVKIVQSFDWNDFPEFPAMKSTSEPICVQMPDLKTVLITKPSDSRAVVSGVSMGEKVFESTDSKRLVRVHVPLANHDRVFVGKDHLHAVTKVFKKSCHYQISEKSIQFFDDRETVSMMLMDNCAFPDTTEIWNDQRGIEFVADIDEPMERMKSLWGKSDDIWSVSVSVSDKKLTLYSGNPETGEVTEVIDIDYVGKSASLTINARYYEGLTGSSRFIMGEDCVKIMNKNIDYLIMGLK